MERPEHRPVNPGWWAALSPGPRDCSGPLFLGIVGIVALFFLFTREIIRFVQFVVLAVAIAVIFYTPSIVQTLAQGIAKVLGVH